MDSKSKDILNELSKSVSALANTFGGTILLKNIQNIDEYISELNINPNILVLSKDKNSIDIKKSFEPLRAIDNIYYYFNEKNIAPISHELLRDKFKSNKGPELFITIDTKLVHKGNLGWSIPVMLENKSEIAARNVKVLITTKDLDQVEYIEPIEKFKDFSRVYKDLKVLGYTLEDHLVYKTLPINIGWVRLAFKGASRSCEIEIQIFADNMKPLAFVYKITASTAKINASLKSTKNLY